MPGSAVPPTNALVAIVERGAGGQAVDERVSIGIVSVVPETGDVVWDEFDGGPLCDCGCKTDTCKILKSDQSWRHA